MNETVLKIENRFCSNFFSSGKEKTCSFHTFEDKTRNRIVKGVYMKLNDAFRKCFREEIRNFYHWLLISGWFVIINNYRALLANMVNVSRT